MTTRPLTSGPETPHMPNGLVLARRPRVTAGVGPLARLATRRLAGVLAGLSVAAAAGCSAVTESEDPAADLAGRYLLTHRNGAQVPVVTDQVPSMTEELQAGDVVLSAGADSTFGLALVWKDTYRESNTTRTTIEVFRGSFTKSGSTVRFRVTEEDGEAEEYPWYIAGELRAGGLRVDLRDELNGAVLTCRKE